MTLNNDTLWLQVPAAKRCYAHQASTPAKPKNIEKITLELSSLHNHEAPYIDKININLFLADHGIANKPITDETIKSYISKNDVHRLLNKKSNTKFTIINLGTITNFKASNKIINSTIASKTGNICHASAMNNEQLAKAINIGRQLAQGTKLSGQQLFIASEVNTFNIISAKAITSALLNIMPDELTELNSIKNNKCDENRIIQQSLQRHAAQLTSPLRILRHLGSFEIASITGSYLCCAHMGLPILVNSLTTAVAALITYKLCPGAEQWFVFSHSSSEVAYEKIIEILNVQPLLPIDTNIDNIASIESSLSLLKLACSDNNQLMCFSNEFLLRRYS